MKVLTLIALLKTYPKNSDISLLGLDNFYIYYFKDALKKNPSILFDTEILDESDLDPADDITILKVLDTRTIHPSFEKQVYSQLDKDDLDDQIKLHKSIIKSLDGSKK
jgi:hypothetical protein